MKELKFKCFGTPHELVQFVNYHNIKREDILIITQGMQVVTLWYYD